MQCMEDERRRTKQMSGSARVLELLMPLAPTDSPPIED